MGKVVFLVEDVHDMFGRAFKVYSHIGSIYWSKAYCMKMDRYNINQAYGLRSTSQSTRRFLWYHPIQVSALFAQCLHDHNML